MASAALSVSAQAASTAVLRQGTALAAAAALPSLSRALLIGRGGATTIAGSTSTGIAAAAATAASLNRNGGEILSAVNLSGGEQISSSDDSSSDNINLFGLSITPQARATLSMATAMATHYLAYSLARPTTLSLFTSSATGFGGKTAAYPLAMGLVSPTSLLLLLGYGGTLERCGPRAALRRSTLYCAATLGVAATLISYLQSLDSPLTLNFLSFLSGGSEGSAPQLLPLLVGALFVFRESYVQLITSQHWSFMSSVLTPSQSSTWFAPISGLTSLASAFAGLGVSLCVDKLHLTGTLGLAAVMLAFSTVLTERAYAISDKYGFNPADEHNKQVANAKAAAKVVAKAAKVAKDKKGEEWVKEEKHSLVKKASDLFDRVPVLKALFVEILASQGVSTILNVCYVSKLSSVIPDDKERAGWSGKFFAVINVVSGFLQFGVLPKLMSVIEPATLWRVMPMIIAGFTTFLSLDADPSLYLVAGTFLTMKAMEFSARRMLDEMVYVPLDFDSRYVGKEVIGVFGYRFGKSGTSLAVSALTSQFDFGLRELSWLTTAAAAWWLRCTWKLSNMVPTRAEAEANYQKIHQKGGGGSNKHGRRR